MREYNINDIVDKLVGHISVACETYHDNMSEENMKVMDGLLFHILEQYIDTYEYKDRHEASAKSLASHARRTLKEVEEYLPFDLNDE